MKNFVVRPLSAVSWLFRKANLHIPPENPLTAVIKEGSLRSGRESRKKNHLDKWKVEIKETQNDLKENVNSRNFFTHIRSRKHLRKLWFFWVVSERKTRREGKDSAAKPDSLFAAILIMISTERFPELKIFFLNTKKRKENEELWTIENRKSGMTQWIYLFLLMIFLELGILHCQSRQTDILYQLLSLG